MGKYLVDQKMIEYFENSRQSTYKHGINTLLPNKTNYITNVKVLLVA